jgi:hypothetical protein
MTVIVSYSIFTCSELVLASEASDSGYVSFCVCP